MREEPEGMEVTAQPWLGSALAPYQGPQTYPCSVQQVAKTVPASLHVRAQHIYAWGAREVGLTSAEKAEKEILPGLHPSQRPFFGLTPPA